MEYLPSATLRELGVPLAELLGGTIALDMPLAGTGRLSGYRDRGS